MPKFDVSIKHLQYHFSMLRADCAPLFRWTIDNFGYLILILALGWLAFKCDNHLSRDPDPGHPPVYSEYSERKYSEEDYYRYEEPQEEPEEEYDRYH
jgi:hypothetical protein